MNNSEVTNQNNISTPMQPQTSIQTQTKTSKKNIMIPIIIVVALILITGIYFLIEYLNPKIEINNLKKEYDYIEFNKLNLVQKTSLFVKKENTLWTLNGYDIYKGKTLKNIPVKSGNNTLTITNGKLTKSYEFNINADNTLLLKDDYLVIAPDDEDYDKDGIPNKIEKEKGLSTYSNDTDGDGLYDNVELIMGLDPTKKDDYNEIRTFEIKQDNDETNSNYIVIKGKGNIANTFLDTYEGNIGISEDNLVTKEMFRISTTNKEEQEVTVYLKKSYLWKNKRDENTIYTYDSNTKSIEALETNCEDDMCSAKLTKLDKILFLGVNKSLGKNEPKNQIHILLDNSGSMYTLKYMREKMGMKYDPEEKDKEGENANDVNFKRVDLMNELVKRLGTEKYEYSAAAFTADYCSLIENSKDLEKIQEKISSIKTDCQNFNGTSITDSVLDEVKKFDTNATGSKFIILLTDGNDNTYFGFPHNFTEYGLKKIAAKGIKIITIGLGSLVNANSLINIAQHINGKYLYSSDSNMLETLISIIEGEIENKKVKIGDYQTTLIADSGFEVKRDGFSFENFGSKDSEGGNCYGFSWLSKKIFLNTLKASDTEKSNIMSVMNGGSKEYKLLAYTLTDNNKKRLIKGNVYSLNLNPKYKEAFDNKDYNRDFEISDYRYVENKVAYINSNYKGKYANLGFEPYFEELSNPTTLFVNGKDEEIIKYETQGYINLTDAKEIADEYKDDYQVLQLINRNYREQFTRFFSALATNIKQGDDKINFKYYKNLNKLIEEIKTGSPAMISIRGSLGAHSVLGNKVYKVDDKEIYIVGIYDSNTPGEEGKAYFERQTSYEKNSKNPYYSFSYTGGGIDFSTFVYVGE